MNLTLIDLPGLTKVAVGKFFSINLSCNLEKLPLGITKCYMCAYDRGPVRKHCDGH